ncbi:MAG: 3'-5' exoribonuclease [Chloroflexota bacterium]|nr:3'-5' exoribonuclease [Chloroflexota bacterium]
MTYIMVDVETDGPIPADYSMICLGAVVVDESLDKRFYGQLKPISEQWIPDALKISGFSRNQTQQFDNPKDVMEKFSAWIKASCTGTPMFISDNNGFDWQFINYYFHHFLGNNPFGFSSTNLGSLYKGLVKDTSKNFKHLRNTAHTHDPLDDAVGNAEALLQMISKMELRSKF